MPTTNTETMEARVMAELDTVLDPCSIHNGTRLSFVELGMVKSIELTEDGTAKIRLLLDDPMCMYVVDIFRTVQEAARRVDGIREVKVEVVGDQLWTDDRLSDGAKAKMRRWREIRLRRMEAMKKAHKNTERNLAT